MVVIIKLNDIKRCCLPRQTINCCVLNRDAIIFVIKSILIQLQKSIFKNFVVE